jgi:hypothetical protein
MANAKDQMTTLSGVLEDLRQKKMDKEFIMNEGKFKLADGKSYDANELTIVRTYRFEGNNDPSDSSILYLIETNDGNTGYSIDAYGVYSNHDDDGYDDFIKEIVVDHHEA